MRFCRVSSRLALATDPIGFVLFWLLIALVLDLVDLPNDNKLLIDPSHYQLGRSPI